jgi:hypothetical protein
MAIWTEGLKIPLEAFLTPVRDDRLREALRRAVRHCERSEVIQKQSFRDARSADPESRDSGFDAPHRPGMTLLNSKHTSAFPPREAPELCRNFRSRKRGRGECRVPVAPAAARVDWIARALVTTVAPGSPGIPARDGFNSLFCALPGDRAFLSPSPVKFLSPT